LNLKEEGKAIGYDKKRAALTRIGRSILTLTKGTTYRGRDGRTK